MEMTEHLWRRGKGKWILPRAYETAEEFEAACIEYFEWCLRNPILENVVGWYQGSAVDHTVEHPRAFTITGLCLHACIRREIFYVWCDSEKYPDLAPVCEWAKNVCYEQKFTGAAVGQFNPSLIAKDLGLVEKVETNQRVVVNMDNDDANL